MNGFSVVNPNGLSKPRDTASVINSIRAGKLNNLFEVTLTAGTTTTTVTGADTQGVEKVGPDSQILPMPLTANAASELAAGTLWVSAQGNGTVTFTHANAGSVDRTFRCSITG